MTEGDITSAYRDIVLLLSEKKLKQAFLQVRKLIAETRQAEFSNPLDDLEQTYSFIRKYTVESIDDPERGKILNFLVVSAFELADRVYENWRGKFSPSFFYRKKRTSDTFNFSNPADFLENFIHSRNAGSSVPSDGENPEKNRLLQESWQKIISLFYSVVFLDKVSNEEKAFVQAIISADDIVPEYKSLISTALTFSVLRYFDTTKLEMLLDLCETNRTHLLVSQRSLTGFLLALYYYDYRMPFYSPIGVRFDLMTEDPVFSRKVGKILLQLTGSKETEKIKQKMDREIMPEMIRISPNIRNKLNFDSLMDEGSSDDRNPDWTELFHDSPGLMEKMEEMAKMQIEGADVFLSSFSMLKNFPFYREFTNWFIPFYADHPEVVASKPGDPEGTGNQITEALFHSPILCNSDKYSFSIMLKIIPAEAREMMAGFLKAEMEQMEEVRKDENLLDPDRESGIVSNQYIQDLYRFFRLHPDRKDFEDIFDWKFDFHNKTGFRNLLDRNPEIIREIAGFYFEKGYYQEALEIFSRSDGQNGESLQKAAYCHQKLGDYEKALSLYRKAELYDVNKIWNLKKMALCYRNLKLPEEALKVYKTLDSLEPENLGTVYAIGYCYSEAGKYQDALNSFFKIEYLSPGNKKVWRPIAWCSFLTGKNEQAEKYYDKLMDEHPDRYDLMNMGHVQWALGKKKETIRYYRQSIQSGGFTAEDFMAVFEEDLQVLIARGIQPEEVSIMLDQLRYSLEE